MYQGVAQRTVFDMQQCKETASELKSRIAHMGYRQQTVAEQYPSDAIRTGFIFSVRRNAKFLRLICEGAPNRFYHVDVSLSMRTCLRKAGQSSNSSVHAPT